MTNVKLDVKSVKWESIRTFDSLSEFVGVQGDHPVEKKSPALTYGQYDITEKKMRVGLLKNQRRKSK